MPATRVCRVWPDTSVKSRRSAMSGVSGQGVLEREEPWVVRVEDPEKGGHATATALGAKVTDEVSHRAVAQGELLGDLRQRPTLDKEGSQNLVAAM
jgi:hypothetical protein